MLSSAELRKNAREQLQGNWGLAVLVGLIVLAINVVTSFDSYLSFLATIILTGPLTAGLAIVYMKMARKEIAQFQEMFDGFKRFVDFFVVNILIFIFVILWALLLIVPGIIAAIRYSQAYYLMLENPNLKPQEAIKVSSQMIDGYKGKYFLMILSFIGWFVLSILTLGVGFIFLIPYVSVTQVNFYNQLKSIQASSRTA